MKIITIAILGLLLAETSEAAWLLWQKTFMTRKLHSAPSNALPQVTIDEWELRNAMDMKSECISGLRDEVKRSYDSLNSLYPGQKVNQSPLGDGVHAGLWTGSDGIYKPTNEPMRLTVQYDFWCLPLVSIREARESSRIKARL